MSQLVPHLPQGYLRWKRLRDQRLLTGLPFQILTLLLDQDDPQQDWTQARVATRLGATMHAVKRAFARLKLWGYYRPLRRPVGRSRVLHFWGVTDEAGDFGELELVAARAFATALDETLSQVGSKVDLQPVSGDPELPSSLRGSENQDPPTPTGDNGAPQAVDERARRRAARNGPRPRERQALAALPPSLADYVVPALTLAHDIGVPVPMRRAVAGYLAVCLAAGHDRARLAHQLTSGMTGANNVHRVVRFRARRAALTVAPQLTGAVEEALGVLQRA